MSTHIGVSCDVCLKTNFTDRRYKCLLCDNYDLCGACFDIQGESQNHLSQHPMQCILTKAAYDLFYAGEAIPHRTIVSLTCPYCARSGFLPRSLLTHCLENHPTISSANRTHQAVMCPICAINPSQSYPSRLVSLADHLAREHETSEAIQSTSTSEQRPLDNKREFFDHDDDDDEGLPLYALAERLFLSEKRRGQEMASNQRLTQSSVRHDYSAIVSGQRTTQRRSISRQTAVRGSRGAMRGHFHHYPYETISRTTAAASGPSFNASIDNITFHESDIDRIYYENSLFDFHSPLSPFHSGEPQFLETATFTHFPTFPSARAQEQNENNDRLIHKKSNLLNGKQKTTASLGQQPPLFQPMNSTQPNAYDQQLWQQHFPPLQPTTNLPAPLTDTNSSHESKAETSRKVDGSSRTQDADPRSLLGKILQDDPSLEHRLHHDQDHLAFFQSILLSSLTPISST